MHQFKRNLHPFNKIRADTQFQVYWSIAEQACPDLVAIAFALRSMTMSEACTERSFSHHKIVHEPRRANMAHEQVQAEVFLRMNWEKFNGGGSDKSKKQKLKK